MFVFLRFYSFTLIWAMSGYSFRNCDSFDNITSTLFAWTYQSGLSVMVQCFSLTTKQQQSAYQPQKPSSKQGEDLKHCLWSSHSESPFVCSFWNKGDADEQFIALLHYMNLTCFPGIFVLSLSFSIFKFSCDVLFYLSFLF
jgi:hypothetical protein